MLITEDTKPKHTNITTIYRDQLNRKVFTKVIKTLSGKAWVQRPGGLIESERMHNCHFSMKTLIKVENVS